MTAVPADRPTTRERTRAKGARVIKLAYRAPFAWAPLLGFLQARAIPEVEVIADSSYLRTARFSGHTGWLRVTPLADEHALQLALTSS